MAFIERLQVAAQQNGCKRRITECGEELREEEKTTKDDIRAIGHLNAFSVTSDFNLFKNKFLRKPEIACVLRPPEGLAHGDHGDPIERLIRMKPIVCVDVPQCIGVLFRVALLVFLVLVSSWSQILKIYSLLLRKDLLQKQVRMISTRS